MPVQRGFHEPADKPRRFYKAVSVEPSPDGFEVRLDARTVRTPKGAKLALPTRALADQVAEEWAAQGETIEVATMHVMRLANTALEAIPAARSETAEQVAQYAGSDLLCYFAEGPGALVERQAAGWGPILDWAEAELGLRFVRVSGIIHQDQPQATLETVKALALSLDDFRLAGLAFGSALFGSTLLAIAVLKGRLSGEAAFDLSRVDEAFQEEKWGIDAEAAERTERLRAEAAMLERWFRALEG
ncbi:ATP12 family chaperone protein [Phenylobacterium terrae]|uniref:ATP12 family chaperone protein n=1 Tax=Phenylobacterium terrae TaxID=2665495 RepID=A0ABW4N355_9CAUL